MEKRGVSDIVTTILIILLALAAIVIVWQAVKSTVETGTGGLDTQTQCMGVDMSIGTITPGIAGAATVQITRNTGGGDDAITPIALVEGLSVTATCVPATLGQLETATCTLSGANSAVASGDEITVGAKIDTTTCPVTVKKTA